SALSQHQQDGVQAVHPKGTMRSISTNDPFLSLAIQSRAAALDLIEQKKPYRAISIIDGALSMAEEAAPGPERDEVMILLKADLARAVFGNGGSSCPNAFREAGPERMFAITLGQARERLGDKHPAVAYVLVAEADMYRARCDYHTAEKLYAQAR